MQGSNFLGYGLQVVTPGDIALSHVTASDNFLWGASLDNCKASSPGICTASGNVAIADSIFNANTTASQTFIDDTGLLVTSGGSVALNNVQANDNRLIGATIDAVGDVAINNSIFTGNKGVTLDSAGIPTFHGNGLQVATVGNISINLVDASNNTLFGALLDSGGDVAISNSTFNNQTSGSATDQTFGAAIQAVGNVFLDTVTANNNGTDGVMVQGVCITVNGGAYSGNGQYGLNLGSSTLNLVSSPTFANNGAGDVFPANPATCAPLLSSGIPAGATNVVASLQTVSLNSSTPGSPNTSTELAFGNMTLKKLLAKTLGSGHLGVFTGKYAYVYSSSGMQIIAFSPTSNGIAMGGS